MKAKRRAAPYEQRLYGYNQEKQKLLQQNPTLSSKELDKAIKKLADKWKI